MSRRYVFGRIEVRPDERRVLQAGEPVPLGARAFDLLLALIEHSERVIGKEELLGLVWPGTVVEENNLTVQVSALRKFLGSESISTVPGRGYRFTLTPDEQPSIAHTVTAAGEVELSLPDKPSIAVLTFANVSGDPEQEYFTDGISEDIITELARFHTLFVIARNSTFTYKGKAIDVRTVGKELGVRYVLEGSIRSLGSRIRVSAQLVDATTGGHIWAEKYDQDLEDVFAVQEEITRSIVAAIAPQVDAEEQARARRLRPESLSAYDLALRARADGTEAYRKSDYELWERALCGARNALELDPRSVIALEVIASMQGRYLFMFMGAGSEAQARWEEGMSAAAQLVELDPSGCSGYTWMAMLSSLASQGSEALSNARGRGELVPTAPNSKPDGSDNSDGRALNRRVEILFGG